MNIFYYICPFEDLQQVIFIGKALANACLRNVQLVPFKHFLLVTVKCGQITWIPVQ